MTKQEFIDELRMNLTGEVREQVIQETIQFYSRYIDEEVKSGKIEAEIIAQLDRPNMIAKSVIEANQDKPSGIAEEKKQSEFQFGTWYSKVIFILLAILAVVIVIAVLGGLLMLLWYIAPVIILVIVIIALIRAFGGNKR